MNLPEIVVPICLKYTNEAVCSLPWYVQLTEYHPVIASYQALVNGQETFTAVHQAIAQAKKSIDIICWGFQPSMYFIRDGMAPSIGELLMAKAREGVEVRLLGWEMPFNTAGFGGEANLPGKGSIRLMDRVMQRTTEEQYAFDRQWFATCAVADHEAAQRTASGLPVFVSRGFNLDERGEIAHWVKYASLDSEISTKMRQTLRWTATHHQKSVLVDYELPDCAVGFIMGHNMLDEYWDTDKHSALNRSQDSKPAPNRGPRGDTPRQDISCQLSGPILEHLHHNFAAAWRKETGEDLLASRQSMKVGPQLRTHGMPQMAQILRTQPQAGKRDIERLYMQAVNNATQFIYIENQYFRWPPLAEFIKSVAATQTQGGRDPGLHGALHLFVITNATDDGIGAGTVNTQRMLESLGRANTIPGVTKLRRIQKMEKEFPPMPRADPNDRIGQLEQAKWKADLERKKQEILDSTVVPEEIPGLKVHICSLVAPDSPGKPWMPVYIHSKLMIINDVFTTHGSANINTRSMHVDSELNIAHEWMSVTQALRRRLWDLHTDKRGSQDDAGEAFDAWQEIINNNKDLQKDKENGGPEASLVEFYYEKAVLKDFD